MHTVTVERECLGRIIAITGFVIGSDVQICLYGGDAPHIGGAAMALPYKSHSKPSAALSSLSVPKHKDEIACRAAAKKVAIELGCVVVATGGIHYDNATIDDIGRINSTIEELAHELAGQLKQYLQCDI